MIEKLKEVVKSYQDEIAQTNNQNNKLLTKIDEQDSKFKRSLREKEQ